MKTLPSKYYLGHFNEFVDFISDHCRHLQNDADQRFLACFARLPEDAQCVLVRSANRKSSVIKRSTLYYDEIHDVDSQIQLLIEAGLLDNIMEQDWSGLLSTLTRPELCSLLKQAEIPFKSSTKRGDLETAVIENVTFSQCNAFEILNQYVVRRFDQHLDYFLFIFFGNLNSRLNKFSMRDMGIMHTRKGDESNAARFDTQDQARTTYFYSVKAHEAKSLNAMQALIEINQITESQSLSVPAGPQAEAAKDKYFFRLGQALANENIEKALIAWNRSNHPEAQERWVREQYKAGNKKQVQARIEGIIAEPESEYLLVFAEDFQARKFNNKRTSVLTDMLRQNSQCIQIDEIYRETVELGVQHYYEGQGCRAFRTENQLWQSLFGLTFWQELHHPDDVALATEFDIQPRSLTQHYFFDKYSTDILQRLDLLTDTHSVITHLTKMAAQHYGKANGVFLWHANLLETLTTFIRATDIAPVKTILLRMAEDFGSLSDGYPDIMIVEEGRVRFEEIKAPGDQLRKNQLLTIRQLRKAGFDVRITQVEWYIDPKQPYVVVDVETTGGKADSHRITEVGMVKMVEGKIIDSWQSLINPQRHISKFITQLTGIDDELVADAPLFAEVIRDIASFLHGSVFVAHNAAFDYSFFRKEFERCGEHFRMPKLCTVREMRKAVPGLRSYSLANLTEHFGIDMSQHHRALSDAQAAAELLVIINQHRLGQLTS